MEIKGKYFITGQRLNTLHLAYDDWKAYANILYGWLDNPKPTVSLYDQGKSLDIPFSVAVKTAMDILCSIAGEIHNTYGLTPALFVQGEEYSHIALIEKAHMALAH